MIGGRRGRGGAGAQLMETAPLTVALIVANIFMYILQMRDTAPVVVRSGTTGGSLVANGPVEAHFILWGPMVAAGDWWRLIGAGFLHANVLHIGTNMLSLYFIGRLVEPAVGTLRTGLIYFVSLVAGSLGVIIADPGQATLGASGAIFGLAGALLVIAHTRGVGLMQSGIGPVILLNLVFTFSIPGISVGGHVGGLIGGGILGFVILELDKRRRGGESGDGRVVAISVAIFAALLLVSYAVARSKYPSVS
ncbi:MAG TPA: rhomboid family intramembrane serine protease [Gaiellales bacterium]|jgi:membrane associated rhomboid family serine protease|nr:rhomboid family intramembrane serine protease [Gaiellales bacterium]